MKEFEKYLKKEYPNLNSGDQMFAWDIWREALGFFNNKFNEGVHPQDIIFAMQKELEDSE